MDLTDKTGRLMATVNAWKDEAFLDDLSGHVHRGGQITRGFSAGGRGFGYRTERVADDTGREVGRKHIIDPGEADVVRYIFTLYANGLTPRAIAHRLNQEHVSSPRSARGRRTGSWLPSTISGDAKRALGILNNPMYAGKLCWNRSRKVRDPDNSDKRTMRVRPRSEWLWADAPELRIVPQELWERVQARRAQRRFTASGATGGNRPKYLRSSLLSCGPCGGSYVLQQHRAGVQHYGCGVRYDRGIVVCDNRAVVVY